MGLMTWNRFGSATDFGGGAILPTLDFKNVFFWSTVAFAFGGVEGASTMGDEIRNARRNIPRALIFAGILITVVYITATFSVLTLSSGKSPEKVILLSLACSCMVKPASASILPGPKSDCW